MQGFAEAARVIRYDYDSFTHVWPRNSNETDRLHPTSPMGDRVQMRVFVQACTNTALVVASVIVGIVLM